MSAIGLDVASIVRQLVSSERAPIAGRIDRTERQVNAQISAIGSLRGAFSGLRDAVGKLSSNDSAQARKVTVATDAGYTASAVAGAAIGRYQVEVLALASSHKIASGAYANADTAVGTGTLSIVSGDTTLDVVIDSENSSLSDIRDAINAAAGGKGVIATIVEADDGAHLVLGALESGAANAIKVSASGGDGGLAGLAYDPATPGGSTQLSAAADASVKVDGLLRTSASNTVTGMLEGITVTLTKAEPGVAKELTVAGDPSVLRSAAKGFISAYNSALGTIASTTSYNASTQVAAALNGDSLVRGTSRDLRDQVSNSVSDLKAMGISIAKDGKLTLDEAAFDAAIAKDAAPAERLFSSETGLAAGFKKTLARLLDSDGLLDSRKDSLDGRTESIADQRLALDRRMTQVEARYRAQFVALDSLITQLQSQGNFLSQQLANLPGF
ncbi:MAG: flagellar filament capping protein FliD [Pseudomonadota bacterium]|nr:flagellar filament capping protein FliD [Pseudomonadota bacterium]